jgi:hypothetical protein
MLEYLEKQIIIDYHMRGEQAELQRDHAEIAEKAKEYLGFEFYYELSTSEAGKALDPESSNFKALMAKSDELNKKYKQDMDTHYKFLKEGKV